MGAVADAFNLAFRDYVVDGVPGSGLNDPDKSEARALGGLLETFLVSVSVLRWNIFGDDSTDNAVALAAMVAELSAMARPPRVVWPAGRYRASTWPNFAYTGCKHTPDGIVVLANTGTGHTLIFDCTAIASGGLYDMQFGELGNPFIIEGGASSKDGVFTQGFHGSTISAIVHGAGTTYSGVRLNWCVCSNYYVKVSSFYGSWVSKPAKGVTVDTDGVNGPSTCNIFHNAMLERMDTGTGVDIVSGDRTLFLGGTSEINDKGVTIAAYPNGTNNIFVGFDMEQNTTYDAYDAGSGNTFYTCTSNNVFIVHYTAFRGLWMGGNLNSIDFDDDGVGDMAQQMRFINCETGNTGGARLTGGNGIKTIWQNVYDGTAGKWVVNVQAPAGSAKTIVALTYSASITIDASLGDIFELTVNDASAFTINAPTNPTEGQTIIIAVRNGTGGALGTLTWDGIFRKAGAWVQPATGFERLITFYRSLGPSWVEVSRSAADTDLG